MFHKTKHRWPRDIEDKEARMSVGKYTEKYSVNSAVSFFFAYHSAAKDLSKLTK